MNMMVDKDTNVPSNDCISRQAARNAMRELYREDLERYGIEIPETFDASRAIEALNELPAAQPDLSSYSDKLWRAAYERGKAEAQPRRLRGRWVETERRGVLAGAKYYKCDKCAQPIVVVDSTPMAEGYNYCPRCGSQMED